MAKNLRSNVLEGGLTVDPTVPPGVAAAVGSILPRRGTIELWQKSGPADTDWLQYGTGAAFSSKGFYGTGIDGAKVVAGTETMTRTMQWTTLVVPSGAVLVTDGYPIFCTTSIEVQAGGIIQANGNAAAGAVAGAATSGASAGARVLGGGTAGAVGGTGVGASAVARSDQLNEFATTGAGSGRGGNGGAGVSGGGNGGTINVHAGNGVNDGSGLLYPWILLGGFPVTPAVRYAGGSGGGGGGGGGVGNTSGAGGGGAGIMALAAPTITNNGAIQAIGGAGANGSGVNTGGGGGGGGGKVMGMCRTYAGTQPDVSGGSPGSGSGGGSAGATGSTGRVVIVTGV